MEAIKKAWNSIKAAVASFWAAATPETRSLFIGLGVGFLAGAAVTGMILCL